MSAGYDEAPLTVRNRSLAAICANPIKNRFPNKSRCGMFFFRSLIPSISARRPRRPGAILVVGPRRKNPSPNQPEENLGKKRHWAELS